MKNITFIAVILILFFANTSDGEENSTEDKLKNNQQTEAQMSFNVSNELIEKYDISDLTINIDVNGNTHIVLQIASQGRKERGNILLLHAEGESPINSRLIQPLTAQLSRQGWNIYLPNIAKENFSTPKPSKTIEQPKDETGKIIEKENEKLNSSMPINDNNDYFESSLKYQEYFSALCASIFKQTEISKLPTMIVANQNSSYWSIECLQNIQNATSIVFLAPSLPNLPRNDLEEKFSKQTTPLFVFRLNNEKNDPFGIALKNRKWHSNFQRVNIGMLSSSKLQKEDVSIAKTITGWIEKLSNK